MTTHLAAALLLAITLLAGCESTGATGGEMGLDALLGEWTLDAVGDDDVASLLSGGERRPTLSVSEDGSVSGFAGVNRFNTSLTTEELATGAFSVGPIMTTRMAGPAPLMELESRVTAALQATTAYRIEGRRLLLSDGSTELLRFLR